MENTKLLSRPPHTETTPQKDEEHVSLWRRGVTPNSSRNDHIRFCISCEKSLHTTEFTENELKKDSATCSPCLDIQHEANSILQKERSNKTSQLSKLINTYSTIPNKQICQHSRRFTETMATCGCPFPPFTHAYKARLAQVVTQLRAVKDLASQPNTPLPPTHTT